MIISPRIDIAIVNDVEDFVSFSTLQELAVSVTTGIADIRNVIKVWACLCIDHMRWQISCACFTRVKRLVFLLHVPVRSTHVARWVLTGLQQEIVL